MPEKDHGKEQIWGMGIKSIFLAKLIFKYMVRHLLAEEYWTNCFNVLIYKMEMVTDLCHVVGVRIEWINTPETLDTLNMIGHILSS